jgi:hypothetical protein
MNDDQTLKILKNRLRAMTRCEHNLLNLDEISHKYQINTKLILNDYFGFETVCGEGKEDLNESFINKLDKVKNELSKILKLIKTGRSDSIAESKKRLETVPKALIALKFKLPMFYVNRLNEFIEGERNDIAEFYQNLNNIKKKFIKNKNDMEILNKLVFEFKLK